MIKIVFIDNNGISNVVDVSVGETLMEAAIRTNINGIDAFCGGNCACATCIINIDEESLNQILPAQQDEKDVLEFAASKTENSRLSCQIKATPKMDGMIVRIPS